MSVEESAETRQMNEFEALQVFSFIVFNIFFMYIHFFQAIYGDDLKDLRAKGAWNKWVPLNVSITLTPQQGSIGTQEFFVQVDLHIICNDKYPNRYRYMNRFTFNSVQDIYWFIVFQKLYWKIVRVCQHWCYRNYDKN